VPVTPLTTIKMAFAGAGILVFGYGIRADQSVVRWIGIALVGVAFVLRFVTPKSRS
jgi:hypothetical protein